MYEVGRKVVLLCEQSKVRCQSEGQARHSSWNGQAGPRHAMPWLLRTGGDREPERPLNGEILFVYEEG